jgi:long-chain acyl-CoA synthetase
MKIKFIEALLSHPQNKTFLITNDDIITYGHFLELISKTIVFLEKSDKKYIFINAEKNEFTLAAYFASQKLGKITCFVDPLTKSPEKFTKLAKDNYFFFTNKVYQEISDIKCDTIKNSDQITYNSFSEVIFTTGTTGKPKGVLLSHETIYQTAKNINLFTKLKNDDVEMHMMPLSHSFGLARVRCSIIAGNTMVFLNGFGNLVTFYDHLEKFKGSVISTVPAGLQFLIKLSKDRISNFSSQIKMIELGSSPMSKEEKISLTKILPFTNICMHYGLTEASRSTFLNFKDDIKFADSVGKQNYGTDIKIFNSNGKESVEGESGEICIKGTNLFSKYIFCNDKASFYGNYFRTGDFGYMNNLGYLFFEGRKDDMINVAGKKVSPLEIEKSINEISFVNESACIEVKNKKNDLIEIIAFVSVNSEESFQSLVNKIKKYLKNKIEYYKIPSTFINIDTIPKTTSGKILRNKLKEL